MSKSDLDIILAIDKTPKKVLSIEEKANGDIQIFLQANQLFRDLGKTINRDDVSRFHGQRIHEYRYSVHLSKNSPTKINVIKLTCRIDNEIIKLSHYTPAIKQFDSFAPIYARRSTNMYEGYDYVPGRRNMQVLAKSESNFTFFHQVFVGPATRKFIMPRSDFDYAQFSFQNFNVVIMWSFLGIPAHDSSAFFHVGTLPDQIPNDHMNEVECVEWFYNVRNQLRHEYIQTLLPQIPYAQVFAEFPFFREGIVSSKQYKKWHKKVLQPQQH